MNSDDKVLQTNNASYKQISIGFLGPKILSQMQIKILSGIKKIAQEHDITLFHFSGPFPNDSKEVISQSSFLYKLISRKKISGIIGWSSQLCNKDGYFFDIEGFLDQNADFPAVFIGKPVKDYPTVVIDNFLGIQSIMNHLIHVHNYRKIAFICGPEFHPYAMERYKTYVHTLKSNNIAFNPKLVSPPYEFRIELGAKAIYHFLVTQNLKPKQDIEAIVAASDVFAFTAIEELKKRNMRIPEDIAVVGFNNRYESLSSNPTMTTIDINCEGIGKESIELLLSMLKGGKKSGIIRTPTKLIIRQSCGCMYGDIKAKKSSNQIPANKDYDAKKELVKKLIRQKEKIISQISKELTIISSIDYKWIDAILTGLIDSIKMESSKDFLQVLGNIFQLMAKYNIDIFIWNQYLLKLREIVIEIIVDYDLRSKVEMLFYYANSLLTQQIEREAANSPMKSIHYQGRIINLYQSIVSAYELSALLEILVKELPAFGIDACYFSLFRNPEESLEHVTLKLAYSSKGVYKLYENEVVFESSQLIPTRYFKKMNNLLYVILPLFFKNTPMGFIIIGISKLSEFNGIIYEVLRSLISSSLQGIMDIQALKKTQALLEKKAEEQRIAVLEANEANQAKTRFLRNMSHEIRTPLNCILGFIDVMQLEKDKNQVNQYINIIKNESNKLMELINQLLDLSKIEAGKLEIKNTRFNIFQTLEIIHSVFSKNARNKGLDYKTNISKDIPAFVIGDSLRLRQIIINLVGNAIKYTQEGGISISASVQKETDTDILLYFEITDTGIGISKENQLIIFDPFVQVEDSMTRKFGGTGLGTAISRQLVTMMGGDIGVKSTVGKGSTFWFTITCKKCAQEEEPVIPGKVKELTDTRKQILKRASILVAEDYPLNRKVVAIHLQKLGCKIDFAENGKIAVNMFMNNKYNIILMDIQMPEMDGLEAAKKIRSLPGGKQIPIIAMTAIAYEDDIKTFKANDMDDVITKPFKTQDFNKTVIYWLTHRKKIENNKI